MKFWSFSQALDYCPCEITLHRETLLDVPIVVGLLTHYSYAIGDNSECIDENLQKVNSKTVCDSQPRPTMWKKHHEWTTLDEQGEGPFPIGKKTSMSMILCSHTPRRCAGKREPSTTLHPLVPRTGEESRALARYLIESSYLSILVFSAKEILDFRCSR